MMQLDEHLFLEWTGIPLGLEFKIKGVEDDIAKNDNGDTKSNLRTYKKSLQNFYDKSLEALALNLQESELKLNYKIVDFKDANEKSIYMVLLDSPTFSSSSSLLQAILLMNEVKNYEEGTVPNLSTDFRRYGAGSIYMSTSFPERDFAKEVNNYPSDFETGVGTEDEMRKNSDIELLPRPETPLIYAGLFKGGVDPVYGYLQHDIKFSEIQDARKVADTIGKISSLGNFDLTYLGHKEYDMPKTPSPKPGLFGKLFSGQKAA